MDFRKLLFGTILSTDMSMHFSWMTSLVELGDSVALKAASGAEEGVATQLGGLNLSEGARERQAGKDRLIILQSLMKCADISNPVGPASSRTHLTRCCFAYKLLLLSFHACFQARPVEISEYWSSALLDEWQHQATLELGLQLPVSVVKQADAGLQAKGQIAFQDLFVAPLFEAGTAVMPGESLSLSFSVVASSFELTLLLSYPSRTPPLPRAVLLQPHPLVRTPLQAHRPRCRFNPSDASGLWSRSAQQQQPRTRAIPGRHCRSLHHSLRPR